MLPAIDRSIFSRASKIPGRGTALWLPTGGLPADAVCIGSHFELDFAEAHTIQDVIEALPFEKIKRMGSRRAVVVMKEYRGALIFRPPSHLTLVFVTHSDELARWETILLKLELLRGGFAINPVVENPLSRFGAALLNLNWEFRLGTKIDLVRLSKREHRFTTFDPRKSTICLVRINPNTTMAVSSSGDCAISTAPPVQLPRFDACLAIVLKYPLDSGLSDSDEDTLARWKQTNPNSAGLE